VLVHSTVVGTSPREPDGGRRAADPGGLAGSFGQVATDYDRLRTRPPDAALDWLLPGRPGVFVDVGAGTGLFTTTLAGRAARVIAVEPDARMRAVLAAKALPGTQVLAGSGESIPVPDASADGLFVSSAWHWMDPDAATAETARVLRDGARFGVIWTGRDRETDWLRPEDWFTESGVDRDSSAAQLRSNIGQRENALPRAGGDFTNIETRTFLFVQPMSPADLVEMLATHSRVIAASPADRERGSARARSAIDALFPGAGSIDVPMRSRCWRADRVPR
jgi:ubiquinone/menaquinone biosynthesis C-methylase UbiE